MIAELRERFQSHSMKSYRSRFQRYFLMCLGSICPLLLVICSDWLCLTCSLWFLLFLPVSMLYLYTYMHLKIVWTSDIFLVVI